MLRAITACLLLTGCSDPVGWCRVEYFFPPIPAEYANDSIAWDDPNAPIIEPDSTIIEYCDGSREKR